MQTNFDEDFLQFCKPGETPLALGLVTYIGGVNVQQPLPEGVSIDPIMGRLQFPKLEHRLEKAILGASLCGPPGCQAEQFIRAFDRLEGLPELFLTNQRLGLAVKRISAKHYVLAWEVPCSAVLAIAHAPLWHQRGRLKIQFLDGSWCCVLTGYIFTAKAKTFVRAFASLKPGSPS